MAAINDYNCLAHGIFKDSTDGMCPHGCAKAMSSVVFLKPPAFHAGRTAGIDKTLQRLADDHGLTDMNNQNGTGAVNRYDPNMDVAANNIRESMLSGQTYASGIGSGDNAIQSTMAAGGYQGDNALSSVKSMLTPPKANVMGSWDGK